MSLRLWVISLMHIPLGHGSHAYPSGSWVSCISLWVMGLMHIPLGHGSHAYPSGSWVSCISLWVMGLMHIPLGHGSHAYPSGSWVSCISLVSLWVMDPLWVELRGGGGGGGGCDSPKSATASTLFQKTRPLGLFFRCGFALKSVLNSEGTCHIIFYEGFHYTPQVPLRVVGASALTPPSNWNLLQKYVQVFKTPSLLILKDILLASHSTLVPRMHSQIISQNL